MMNNLDIALENYKNHFNNSLKLRLSELQNVPNVIKEAVEYSIVNGGKRIRPVLCYITADMLGIGIDCVDKFALAVEMIHSYSLIHDDLPCMDNDDYRRGQLSTHKKFGQAIGVLAGDALLNLAFETALSKTDFDNKDAKALKILADYSGCSGMIAGQVLDIECENISNGTEQLLHDIYINKTCKLITAPLLIASCLANYKCYDQLKELGYNLGLLFQITDDVLDVVGTVQSIGKTPHKDAESGKFTSISVYGVDNAKNIAKECYEKCKNILNSIPNSVMMQYLLDKIYFRNN